MSTVVMWGDRPSRTLEATVEGENRWIEAADLKTLSGWELKPEGVCRGEVCVPIPAGREAEFSRDNGKRFNLAALAKLIGQPVVYDDKHSVWLSGEAANTRRDAMRSIEAPDFELPDLDGKTHRLSDYRGKKVLLSAWASW